VSSFRPLDIRVAHEIHVLCLRPCKRCLQPFECCRSCQPGRVYCEPCSVVAQREREREAHKTYRNSAEGRRQHHDEEHRRRKRRREEQKGGRDRRTDEGGTELQVTPKAGAEAFEEARGGPLPELGAVEWVVLAWPGLQAAARRLEGAEATCPFCGRSGRVARVVTLEQWQRERCVGWRRRAESQRPP